MAGLGWLGMGLPEACGGLPSSLADLYAFYLEMGRNLVDVPHLETVVVAGGLIAAAGGGAHDDLLTAIAAGGVDVVPTLCEINGGLRACAVEAEADQQRLPVDEQKMSSSVTVGEVGVRQVK